MLEKMKNSAVLKMFVLKLLAYLLIIISFVMFGKGWLTFQSSKARRDITKGVSSTLNQLQGMSQSEWDELNDYLADYDLDISAEELVEKEIDALTVLEDAEVSPKEAMIFITRASWLSENAGQFLGIEGNLDYKRAIEEVKTYSILIQVLYYATILTFIGAVFAMVTCRGIGTYPYSIMTVIQFILFAVFKSNIDTFMNRALGALGIYASGENLTLRFCTPAFASLICAIAASIVWSILLVMSIRERIKIPGMKMLIGKIAKGGDDRKILPKGQVCSCGAKLDKNDKFCPACGKKVMEKVSNTCIKCGAVLEPDSMFCPECGTKVEQIQQEQVIKINKCHFCGKELEQGALFCSSCGRKQTDEDDKTVNIGMFNKNKVITLVNSEDRSWQVKGILQNGSALNVGRSDDMDLKVDLNNSVSRRHCKIFMKDGEVYVEDLNSSYSTYVDDKLVDTPLSLRNGSILKLGTCMLEVHVDDMNE